MVRAEVPGFTKDEIGVSVSGNMLTLSGDIHPCRYPPRWTNWRRSFTSVTRCDPPVRLRIMLKITRSN